MTWIPFNKQKYGLLGGVLALSLLVVSCNRPATAPPVAPPPTLLWNGQVGLHVLTGGPPQKAYSATEGAISSPLTLQLSENGRLLGAPHTRVFDERTGLLKESWNGPHSQWVCETILSPTSSQIAQRLCISALKPTRIRIEASPSSGWATRTSPLCPVNQTLPPGKTFVLEVVSSPQNYSSDAQTLDFASILEEAERYWQRAWQTDIVLDGPEEDQHALRALLFALRASQSGASAEFAALSPFSPFGLSSERYQGHVFWDADLWIFPALALLDPTAARRISEFRLRTARIENGQLRFPWEAGSQGEEKATGRETKQIQITGSVLLGLEQASALGFVDSDELEKLGRAAARYYLGRFSRKGDFWQLEDVMSPDEYTIGDNDLYTNLLAWRTIQRYLPEEAIPREKLWLPHDAEGFLTYDGDRVMSYKQAAAVLAIYPLQDPEAEKQARAMLGRFESKVSPYGPAMSDSIHALIWARLGEADRAYETWKKDWKEHTFPPFFQFSEKRGAQETYFLTGAAGSLQTVTYGFLGFRLDSKQDPHAAWSKKVEAGWWLNVTPHLPKAWKSVEFRNFHVLGKRYTLRVSHDQVQVTQIGE